MAAYSQSITVKPHNTPGRVRCELTHLPDASMDVETNVLYNNSRHDVIAACENYSGFDDNFGYTH